jgi:hypothetical protein
VRKTRARPFTTRIRLKAPGTLVLRQVLPQPPKAQLGEPSTVVTADGAIRIADAENNESA